MTPPRPQSRIRYVADVLNAVIAAQPPAKQLTALGLLSMEVQTPSCRVLSGQACLCQCKTVIFKGVPRCVMRTDRVWRSTPFARTRQPLMLPPTLAPSLTPKQGKRPGCLFSWRPSTSATHHRHASQFLNGLYTPSSRKNPGLADLAFTLLPFNLYEQGGSSWACSGLPHFLESGARVTTFGLQPSSYSVPAARLHSLMSKSLTRSGRRPVPAVPSPAPVREVSKCPAPSRICFGTFGYSAVNKKALLLLQMHTSAYETQWQSNCPTYASIQRKPVGRNTRPWTLYTPDGRFARTSPRACSNLSRTRCKSNGERKLLRCENTCCAVFQALQAGVKQATLVTIGALSRGTASLICGFSANFSQVSRLGNSLLMLTGGVVPEEERGCGMSSVAGLLRTAVLEDPTLSWRTIDCIQYSADVCSADSPFTTTAHTNAADASWCRLLHGTCQSPRCGFVACFLR